MEANVNKLLPYDGVCLSANKPHSKNHYTSLDTENAIHMVDKRLMYDACTMPLAFSLEPAGICLAYMFNSGATWDEPTKNRRLCQSLLT